MIGLGSDHGGFELKNYVKDWLVKKGYEVMDFGSHNEESVDYPDIAKEVCNAVVSGEVECGMLFCGTGIGMSIAANKINGIRAACVSDTFSAKMTKQHNNANVICLGGRTLGSELAKEIIEAYLKEDFEGGRHEKRVNKIAELENQNRR
ncbi:MAG: ribose 5-phosphate isomerase B [Clostridia bacterium]|nr:ribose 5-phosphate isomerase B [Clostridia bacterium]